MDEVEEKEEDRDGGERGEEDIDEISKDEKIEGGNENANTTEEGDRIGGDASDGNTFSIHSYQR